MESPKWKLISDVKAGVLMILKRKLQYALQQIYDRYGKSNKSGFYTGLVKRTIRIYVWNPFGLTLPTAFRSPEFSSGALSEFVRYNRHFRVNARKIFE
jgi:hypothetical protein